MHTSSADRPKQNTTVLVDIQCDMHLLTATKIIDSHIQFSRKDQGLRRLSSSAERTKYTTTHQDHISATNVTLSGTRLMCTPVIRANAMSAAMHTKKTWNARTYRKASNAAETTRPTTGPARKGNTTPAKAERIPSEGFYGQIFLSIE